MKREEIELSTSRVVITAPDGVSIDGGLTATGDMVAGGVSLMHHTHD